MAHVVITRWDANNRVDKFIPCADAEDAAARRAAIVDAWPNAFIAEISQGKPNDHVVVDGALSYSPAQGPTSAELAARIVVSKAKFSVQFRLVYAAQGAPLGPIPLLTDVPTWLAGVLAALPAGEGEALTVEQRTEAVDRWAAASVIERANPLIDLIAPVAFGDSAALEDEDPAVVLAEFARVSALTDQLFLNAEALP